MTTATLITALPNAVHISAGDAPSTITYQATIADITDNPAKFTLEIVDDTDIVFDDGSSSVDLPDANLTTTMAPQPPQVVTFHLAGHADGETPVMLRLTATDRSGLSTHDNIQIIYS